MIIVFGVMRHKMIDENTQAILTELKKIKKAIRAQYTPPQDNQED